jgi:hypothetical protein
VCGELAVQLCGAYRQYERRAGAMGTAVTLRLSGRRGDVARADCGARELANFAITVCFHAKGPRRRDDFSS